MDSKRMAFGGVMAALALVIMSLGTLIPIATYAAPMNCALLLQVVLNRCGRKTAWTWYGAVAILSMIMTPDKEAAAVFAFLGYYPIVKPSLDSRKGKWLWKALLFNAATAAMYFVLLHLLGLNQLGEEFRELGMAMLVVLLILGNVTFFLLDHLLGRMARRR